MAIDKYKLERIIIGALGKHWNLCRELYGDNIPQKELDWRKKFEKDLDPDYHGEMILASRETDERSEESSAKPQTQEG